MRGIAAYGAVAGGIAVVVAIIIIVDHPPSGGLSFKAELMQSSLAAQTSSDLTPDYTGESYLWRERENPDERMRLAALIDALRKVAAAQNLHSNRAFNLEDTTEVHWDKSGLTLTARIIRRRGLMLSNETFVRLSDGSTGRGTLRWRVEDGKLVEPASGDATYFKEFTRALLRRHIDITGGRLVSGDIWQETLSIGQ